MGDELDTFVTELTGSQTNLRAYILATIGNRTDAHDILQRTNLVLWKNAASFRPGAPFMPWAITIAKYEIRSYYRERGRDRHVFSEDVAMLMLQTVQEEVADPTERQYALRHCLGDLPAKSRRLIQLRYESEFTLQQIAEKLRQTESAVKSAFARVRRSLEACVERRLAAESRETPA
ncbi:RNA polymerase sigma factor [Planctomycetes bacterium K2D]|uniref:RNA polymerase sigma factor n=2 Tax=Botrimarina mediterranea TaxID=2528022 RepID=A0A518K999_9BACT|nr:RNA polymerase sigma factor [Botrimarina mediterranea]QDV78949.1 RNA polymerase sigma factor [Planctomycetes bacterium K2D]